jgi:SAM-dependent methyltransferase
MHQKVENLPNWAELAQPLSGWSWEGRTLFQDGASRAVVPTARKNNPLAKFIVSHIYGRQNRARTVRDTIAAALSRLPSGAFGLNFGAGESQLSGRMIALDVVPHHGVDIVSNGSLEIPLRASSLALIISQEVLEHVRDPHAAIAEFHRVLSPGGELVLQLPFIIGYHPGPEDLWRFSTEAYRQLLSSDHWEIVSKRISVGHGTGFHRILTEFAAIHFSVFGNKVYRAAKGGFAVLFSPIIFFDALTRFLPERDRIPGGYIVLAKAIK